jgi:DnaJ-class molecular chaperone
VKLCTTCKGVGHFDDVDCPTCGGEGILASPTTFVRSKIKRKSFEEHEAIKSKSMKFDKKNAIRGGY